MRANRMILLALALLMLSSGTAKKAMAAAGGGGGGGGDGGGPFTPPDVCRTFLIANSCDESAVSCEMQCQRKVQYGKVTGKCVPEGCQCTVCKPGAKD